MFPYPAPIAATLRHLDRIENNLTSVGRRLNHSIALINKLPQDTPLGGRYRLLSRKGLKVCRKLKGNPREHECGGLQFPPGLGLERRHLTEALTPEMVRLIEQVMTMFALTKHMDPETLAAADKGSQKLILILGNAVIKAASKERSDSLVDSMVGPSS